MWKPSSKSLADCARGQASSDPREAGRRGGRRRRARAWRRQGKRRRHHRADRGRDHGRADGGRNNRRSRWAGDGALRSADAAVGGDLFGGQPAGEEAVAHVHDWMRAASGEKAQAQKPETLHGAVGQRATLIAASHRARNRAAQLYPLSGQSRPRERATFRKKRAGRRNFPQESAPPPRPNPPGPERRRC